jgi:putative CRISPR-associated protein (TIGR02620 family)
MIVVTRHPTLVDYLREQGLIGPDAEVISHATPEQIRGRHVVGVLPLSLACEAASVTEIPLALAPEDRGQELSLERVREIAGAPVTYVVQEVSHA